MNQFRLLFQISFTCSSKDNKNIFLGYREIQASNIKEDKNENIDTKFTSADGNYFKINLSLCLYFVSDSLNNHDINLFTLLFFFLISNKI